MNVRATGAAVAVVIGCLLTLSASPLLEAASAGTSQKKSVGGSKGIMRSEKALKLGRTSISELFPDGFTTNALRAALNDTRHKAATFSSGDETRQAAVRAQIPRIDRLLEVLQILDAPASERRLLIRQLPVAAAVLSRPRPAPEVGKLNVTVQQPDGSGGSSPTADDRELCEDEDGWAECATDEELLDAEILHDQLAAELDANMYDLAEAEGQIEDYCDQNPNECLMEVVSTQLHLGAPDLEEEGAEGVDSAVGGFDLVGCAARQSALDCLAAGAGALLGIDTAATKVSGLWNITKAIARTTARKLATAMIVASGTVAAATVLVGYTIYCVANMEA